MKSEIKAERYLLKAANGHPVRIATKAVFSDGFVVYFMERMSKKEVLRQAPVIRHGGKI
jgi:hypothetical protein